MKKTWLSVVVVLTLASSVAAAPKKSKTVPAGKYSVLEGMHNDYGCVELRDDSGKLWPMIWLSHPGGKGEVSIISDELTGRHVKGRFVLAGAGKDVQLVAGSRQDKRIAGGLVRSEEYVDNKGNAQVRRAGPDIQLAVVVKSETDAAVTVTLHGKTVVVDATLTIGPASPRGKGGVDISGSCHTTASALGLTGNDPVTIRFYTPGRVLQRASKSTLPSMPDF